MAGDIFLKLSDIEGECTDKSHEKEMEIESFSWGASQAVSPRSTAGSATQERVNISELMVVKKVDAASPDIFKACCHGKPLAEAVLSINRADGKGSKVDYLTYKLAQVIISRYDTSGADQQGLPTETLCLNASSWTIEYKPTDQATGDAMGAKAAGWDLAKSEPI